MSAEPLTREEREMLATVGMGARWEATVQAEEAGRKAAEERADALREALEELAGPEGGSYWNGIARRALAADDAARGEG